MKQPINEAKDTAEVYMFQEGNFSEARVRFRGREDGTSVAKIRELVGNAKIHVMNETEVAKLQRHLIGYIRTLNEEERQILAA